MLKTAAISNPMNLDGMTKAELMEYARDHGIDGISSSMLKADMKNLILSKLGGESQI